MSERITRPPRSDDPEDLADFREQIERQLNLVGSRTVDLGVLADGTVGTFTVPVIGCRVNHAQAVAVAAPSTFNAGCLWCGAVTADDTVTIYVLNASGAPIDPAEATWGARVFL